MSAFADRNITEPLFSLRPSSQRPSLCLATAALHDSDVTEPFFESRDEMVSSKRTGFVHGAFEISRLPGICADAGAARTAKHFRMKCFRARLVFLKECKKRPFHGTDLNFLAAVYGVFHLPLLHANPRTHQAGHYHSAQNSGGIGTFLME
jgi:hypothetical protein